MMSRLLCKMRVLALAPPGLRAGVRNAHSRRINSRWAAGELRAWGTAAFRKVGLPPEDASLVAKCLVQADLRAQPGHGLQRLPLYCKRIRAGIVNPTPNVCVTQTSPSSVLVDGDDGMGFVVATAATDKAIELARTQGLGLAGVRRSTHFGCSAHYVLQALNADMVALVFTNSSPALPPHGGAKALLGASPFAAGAPSGFEHPLVLDMSTTVVARGKLRLAAQRGELIPPGVGLNPDGQPTRDGMEVFHGVTLPFGGAKGAALSMLMEVLAGVFTGSNFAGKVRSLYNDFEAPQNVGHFILCMRPDIFLGSVEDFKGRMDTLARVVKAQPRAEGVDEILMPGEPESRAEAANVKKGVPMQDDVVQSLRAEAESMGLHFPEPRA